MDACHCTFSKPTECTTRSVNPKVNYGLWLIMRCQCRFIICNKSPLVSVDNGGGSAFAGVGGIWEIPVLSSQFCCESKVTVEKKRFKKKQSKGTKTNRVM